MAASTCQETDDLCRHVERITGNEWLAEASNWLIAKPLTILLLIVVGLFVRWLLHRVIKRLTMRAATGAIPAVIARGKVPEMFLEHSPEVAERRQQRADTMGGLLKSITTSVVAAIVVLMALAEVGLNIAPLIASAGILGVALGFGAQTLVKDFLSGIFMILEDQYGVGDVVNLGAATGTVEAVGLRVTRLRDVNGTVWYLRNGELLAVGNMSQNWARTVLDIPVAFSEDLEHVRDILVEVGRDLWEDPEFEGDIIEEPEVWGWSAGTPTASSCGWSSRLHRCSSGESRGRCESASRTSSTRNRTLRSRSPSVSSGLACRTEDRGDLALCEADASTEDPAVDNSR